MELAQIRDTLQNRPFRPFLLRLADGREYTVPHPGFLYIPPNMRHTVIVANTATGAASILDAIMIASITFTEDSGTNGHSAGPNGHPTGGNGTSPT